MNRNFDYVRGELLMLLKNQDKIMDTIGIKRTRSSVQETKETARSGQSNEDFSKFFENKVENKQFMQKTLVIINNNDKNITNFNKESK